MSSQNHTCNWWVYLESVNWEQSRTYPERLLFCQFPWPHQVLGRVNGHQMAVQLLTLLLSSFPRVFVWHQQEAFILILRPTCCVKKRQRELRLHHNSKGVTTGFGVQLDQFSGMMIKILDYLEDTSSCPSFSDPSSSFRPPCVWCQPLPCPFLWRRPEASRCAGSSAPTPSAPNQCHYSGTSLMSRGQNKGGHGCHGYRAVVPPREFWKSYKYIYTKLTNCQLRQWVINWINEIKTVNEIRRFIKNE